MKNKKTQSTMIAMATTLAMSGVLQPLAIYAQEEQPQIVQQSPSNTEENVFTDTDVQQALAKYNYTNETEAYDIKNYLNTMLLGKMYGDAIIQMFEVVRFDKSEATLENRGSIHFEVSMHSNGIIISSTLPRFSFEIPSLTADYQDDVTLMGAIKDEVQNYPFQNTTSKEEVEIALNEKFLGKTYIAIDEIRSVKSIFLDEFSIKEATIENEGTITFRISWEDNHNNIFEDNPSIFVFSFKADYHSSEEVIIAIKKELQAYSYRNETTDEDIKNMLTDKFVTKTFVENESSIEVQEIDTISVSILNKQEATGIENGSIIMEVIIHLGVSQYSLDTPIFEIPALYPLSDIPDEEFRKFLFDTVDEDKDGYLTRKERDAVETLTITKTTIEDLTGIDIFKNLKNLYCNEQVRRLDVSQNEKLEVLHCSSTQITSLDLRNNPNLEILVCSGATQLDTLLLGNHPALTTISAQETNLSSIDISECPTLETLSLSDTQIQSIHVANNPLLETLALGNTQITDIDVSGNPVLASLILNGTKQLTSLDVRANSQLQTLNLNSSSISYLNLLSNTNVTMLDVENTNLGYLLLSSIPSEQFNLNHEPVIQTEIYSDTFNIKDIFPGIDLSRISNVKNATFDVDKGIISKYAFGTSITYEYAYIQNVNGRFIPTSMKVTLQIPKAYGYIHIVSASDVVYTGSPVANPTDIRTLSGAAEPIFYYHELVDGQWLSIQGNPIEVGTYRVDAFVPENEQYLEAETSEEVTFDITQATNAWNSGPSIEDWTYGEQPKNAIAEAKFGKTNITYSDSRGGVYTDAVPSNAGAWYMKASVEGTKNYTGLQEIVKFVIGKKNVHENPDIKIPDIENDKDLAELVIQDGEDELEEGKDYEIDKKQEGEETIVTIIFEGNYAGEVVKHYPTNAEQQPETEEHNTETEKKEETTDAIKETGSEHHGAVNVLSMLLAGCGLLLMRKKKKETK